MYRAPVSFYPATAHSRAIFFTVCNFNDDLISIIAQFESGLDYSPMYDPPVGANRRHPVGVMVRTRWPSALNKLRYRYDLERIFRGRRHQEDVLVNAIYGQGLRALGRLALAEGKADLAAWSDRQAAAVTDALLERSYDEDAGLFWNLYGPHEVPSRIRTVGSLMPLVLEDLPFSIVERLVETLTDRRHFWTPYPIPSVARSEPTFVPGIHVKRHASHLARPAVDEHELVPRRRPANTRVHGAREHYRRAFTRARRAGRLQRVLRPAVGRAGRPAPVRLGDPCGRHVKGGYGFCAARSEALCARFRGLVLLERLR